eukprot:TRINITY_DN107737_c0_g1_i1.p1 TRINITY_DN107737_c0_g1~~TRINITY_DN107737_c0_g1_i1.p1  ORF type:complete len:119 (+),score=41.70 TRINITY_DN107737_c0_g1_i1:94-450(+)
MGNCEGYGFESQMPHATAPQTTERLHQAIGKLELKKVQDMVEMGVPLNEELKETGTALDACIAAQGNLVTASKHEFDRSNDPKATAAWFKEKQAAAHEIMDLLLAKGAKTKKQKDRLP